MASVSQEFKALQTREYTPWRVHAARGNELIQDGHEQRQSIQYALSGACAGLLNGHIAVLVGGHELPFDAFQATSRLDLFDLSTHTWLESYDIDGALVRRIGHSVVTISNDVYVFGGERIDVCAPVAVAPTGAAAINNCLSDVYALSFAQSVLRCRALGVSAAVHDGATDSTTSGGSPPAPCARAWHASACVKVAAAGSSVDSDDNQLKDDALLVLGGRDASGKLLSDIWLLILEATASTTTSTAVRWSQLTPTGTSPLPLAYHRAVALHDDSSRVVVLGGKQTESPSAPMLSDVFVLDVAANAWSTLVLTPSTPLNDSALLRAEATTARCCCTALSLVLPIDESNGNVVLVSDVAASEPTDEQHVQAARDFVVVYGGYSVQHAAIAPTTYVLLDIANSTVRELALPNAGLLSYVAHASVASHDRKSLFVFGGIDSLTNAAVDTTSALHFWTPQQRVDNLESDATDAAANRMTTQHYDNGDVYVGELLAVPSPSSASSASVMLRHGVGKCTFANGDVYDGTWRDDAQCGQGTMVYSNGDVYVGQWERNMRHGDGIQQYHVASSPSRPLPPAAANAQHNVRVEQSHDGHWLNDVKSGSGTTTFTDGSQLVATWSSDNSRQRMRGRIERYDDSTNGVCTYDGELTARDNLPDGDGTSDHAQTGERYTGQWHAGRRSGHGTATLRDGSTYTGAWRNGKRNGVGTFTNARTRDVYVGKWVGNQRCGHGTCTYANGSVYDGAWSDDACDGVGRFTFAATSVASDGGPTFYEGSWRANKFCGDGALVLNDSRRDERAAEH